MGKGSGYGGDSIMKKDYQPGEAQFAGKAMGKTNAYMERTDKRMVKEASQVKKQAYKGRYD